MSTTYKFNPEDYGFEPIEKFPELSKAKWYGSNTFIKVVENGGKEFGRKVFWYKACKLNNSIDSDDRVSFYSHSFDVSKSLDKNFDLGSAPRITYNGLVSSHNFAVLLLKNLLGTTRNESVETDGKERLERNINEEAKK